MDNGFAFSEVVRKLANLIRIGKIAEIDGDKVKVQIDRVKTGWLPIVSTAGDTIGWIPLTVGEQVAVFSPYGESAQAFVLRSIHYNDYKAPEEDDAITLQTTQDVKATSEGQCEAEFEDGFEFKSGDSVLRISDSEIYIECGDSSLSVSDSSVNISSGGGSISVSDGNVSINGGGSISVSDGGINLSLGSSTIDLSSGNISIDSGNVSINPPVCKCEGGM